MMSSSEAREFILWAKRHGAFHVKAGDFEVEFVDISEDDIQEDAPVKLVQPLKQIPQEGHEILKQGGLTDQDFGVPKKDPLKAQELILPITGDTEDKVSDEDLYFHVTP